MYTFDKKKANSFYYRYKLYFLETSVNESKKKSSEQDQLKTVDLRSISFSSSYDILAQSPSFSIQAAKNKKTESDSSCDNSKLYEAFEISPKDKSINIEAN